MHVIDKALHQQTKKPSPFLTDDILRDIRTIIPKARRFVFGVEESEFVGRFIRNFGDVLITNRQLAIPPYENTYIEFDINSLIRGIGRSSTYDMASFKGPHDVKHGFLIRENHVYSVTEDSSGGLMLSPLHFFFNSRVESDLQFSDNREENNWQKLAFCMGTTVHDMPSEEARLDLINSIEMKCEVPKLFRSSSAAGFNGEVRNLLALLLILNKHSDRVQLQNVPPKGILYKGKRQVYAAHSVVKILLGEKEPSARAFTGLLSRDGPRRHQVRGFFRNYHQDKSCEHAFPLVPNDKEQWICPKCGTIRVWVKEFERGDASKGYVTKEYETKIIQKHQGKD